MSLVYINQCIYTTQFHAHTHTNNMPKQHTHQLKEFRQAAEDRHTHLYQNPYYPPPEPQPKASSLTTGAVQQEGGGGGLPVTATTL